MYTRTVPSRNFETTVRLRFTGTRNRIGTVNCTAVCRIRYGSQPYNQLARHPRLEISQFVLSPQTHHATAAAPTSEGLFSRELCALTRRNNAPTSTNSLSLSPPLGGPPPTTPTGDRGGHAAAHHNLESLQARLPDSAPRLNGDNFRCSRTFHCSGGMCHVARYHAGCHPLRARNVSEWAIWEPGNEPGSSVAQKHGSSFSQSSLYA